VKTDTIFYQLFQAFPSIFFELINRTAEEAATYEFTSREIKQLAFRLDGLFLPTTNNPNQPFYVVEVQFQPDEDLYYRLFAELFLYLKQYKPQQPWQAVLIYPTRSIEREQNLQFRELLPRVQRIYLDELGDAAESSIGVGVVKLVIEPQQTAPALAKHLIEQTKQQLTNDTTKRDIIDLIETIIVYKLPQKSREEIEAMLGLSELKQTKVYQEAFVEGEQIGELKAKLTTIPDLIQLEMNLSVIAGVLKLPVEVVQRVAQLFHAQNVTAFIELLTSQRSLFSAEDINNLTQMIEPLPDEIEVLSQAIEQWCKQPEHSAKLEVLLQIRQNLFSGVIETLARKNPETILTFASSPLKQMLQSVIETN
jgi:predicted transposase/invertase (TIGR01784 family)